ncbi:MAG: smalltalk protein, partial [Prevotella sp.]|nr:smalltalk protein [Prevotella sp.]
PLWKTIIDVIIVILTSIVTTVGTTSCMRGL